MTVIVWANRPIDQHQRLVVFVCIGFPLAAWRNLRDRRSDAALLSAQV
ncbi:MAG: hypothetical protein KBE17_07790 [Acidovorax sp.]|nr:hypothetical protein [Acidovorax sp.]